MSLSRRQFVLGAGATAAALAIPGRSPGLPAPDDAFRVCFFTDSHLPYGDTVAHLPEAKFHHQQRIRNAFDRANEFSPGAFIFGGDNVFAVDDAGDTRIKEDNARAQFDNWKKLVAEKVKVPHHSVIGNHDIWHGRPAGEDAKALAIAAFGMPGRYYSWKMRGWKFVMLDVFDVDGAPLDKEQLSWLEREVSEDLPICIVTHAPIMSVTGQLVGGTLASPKVLRELFFAHPQVRLALSGHNHMVDECTFDRVTYLCGGAVSGGWWEGDYEHFPPTFVILDLKADGSVQRQFIRYEEKA